MKLFKLFIILLLVGIVSGCGKDIIREGNGDLIIEYNYGPTYGTKEDVENRYIINVYDNKTVEYGYKNDEKKTKDIDSETYQKLINEVFSDSFLKLDEDVSNTDIVDGGSSEVILHLEDGSTKKIGGANSTNKRYNKVEDMLKKLKED